VSPLRPSRSWLQKASTTHHGGSKTLEGVMRCAKQQR
jgi:hypothetical protein